MVTAIRLGHQKTMSKSLDISPQGEGDKVSLREFHVNETVFKMQSVAAHSR
jgi:hypothetical protein